MMVILRSCSVVRLCPRALRTPIEETLSLSLTGTRSVRPGEETLNPKSLNPKPLNPKPLNP